MDYLQEVAKYVETEKQKNYNYNFREYADQYETWDEVDFDRESISEITYEVKPEDLISYAEGALDTNPLFIDEEYTKKSGYEGVISHPLLGTMIEFWCLRKGEADFMHTPGTRNPGHRWEYYEPFRVGDIIRVRTKPYDKWIKRGKYYLTYQMDFIDQNDRTKQKHWLTLVMPKSREDVARIMRGEPL